jgi:hypothetical protein
MVISYSEPDDRVVLHGTLLCTSNALKLNLLN